MTGLFKMTGDHASRGKKKERVASVKPDAIPIMVLAAGPSSRLGTPKQLLSFQKETLLHRVASKAVDSRVGPVIIVLGSHAEEISATVSHLPVHILIHPDWERGMGSSIKAGLQFAMNRFAGTPAVIISVCDQFFLEARHLRQLKKKFIANASELVAARYANGVGVPCLFSKKFFPALMELSDDQGAKRIILAHAEESAFISFPQGDVDVDTVADWEAIKKMRPGLQA